VASTGLSAPLEIPYGPFCQLRALTRITCAQVILLKHWAVCVHQTSTGAEDSFALQLTKNDPVHAAARCNCASGDRRPHHYS